MNVLPLDALDFRVNAVRAAFAQPMHDQQRDATTSAVKRCIVEGAARDVMAGCHICSHHLAFSRAWSPHAAQKPLFLAPVRGISYSSKAIVR